MTEARAAAQRLADWHENGALPLWACIGVDAAGGFYECVDFAGAPRVDVERRVRVQCRQIHAFSQAARRGSFAAGETIAARGFERLLATACPDEGRRGCVHRLSAAGDAIDTRRDLYDQAFLLLACASRIRSCKDPTARALATRVADFLDRELASPAGGYLQDDRDSAPRRQNPHMHLFEAFLALYDATGETRFLDRAGAMDHLFRTRFFDAGLQVLRETFGDDWSVDASHDAVVEPGHMMEWVFLLDRFEKLAGVDRGGLKAALYRRAQDMAAQPSRFLPNAVRLGAPSPSPSGRRLWPQTEYLRAAAIMGRDDDVRRLIDALFASYLDQPVAGLWCDEYSADGRPIASDVPASILYHIDEAVAVVAARYS